MAKKTNKTSHVLNLITNGTAPDSEPAVPGAKERRSKEIPVRPGSAGDKNVIVVNKSSENDKLSNEILNNLTTHLEETCTRHEAVRLVNVMEQILNQVNLELHMKNYDLCLCERCRIDVLALTLTRLPSKYVVVDDYSVAPIIGYYESRYRIRILTEIIKSCLAIKENPRHGHLGMVLSIKG